MKTLLPKIDDEASASSFIAACVGKVGLGYHPDTPFAEYVAENGIRCFSDEEARSLDEATEVAFRHCDAYSVALEAAQRILKT
jgi:hypothetical protein